VHRVITVVVILATLLGGSLAVASPAAADEPEPPIVAIVVGPVGSELTPTYIDLAEMAATAAEARGAEVRRAYSPDATTDRVLTAVADADVVVYFGHGLGTPNPYSDTPDPDVVNGWTLNGPLPSAEHADTVGDGAAVYVGEAWIAEHARPAPGWVMIYSNACYAPGAGEGFDPPADEATAAARVSAYSRTPLGALGASAYFATDFWAGAAHLVATLLDHPDAAYADIFASEPNFQADAVTALPHGDLGNAELLLHHTPYFAGVTDYWYAFAGDPEATFAGGAATARLPGGDSSGEPLSRDAGYVIGLASNYSHSRGHEGEATVALPVEVGGRIPDGTPETVLVCADRCVTLPLVDSCPCYVGTERERVANLSHAAWALVSDAPLEEGLVPVIVYFEVETDPPDRSGKS
jgi:hypothetical protein